MIAVLSGAGLSILESGAVGIKDLQFVLATRDHRDCEQRPATDESTHPPA